MPARRRVGEPSDVTQPFFPATLAQVASAVTRLGTSDIEPVGGVLADLARTVAELRVPRRPAPGEPYWRSPLYRTAALEIVLMCFGRAGDLLPHDHGSSAGWVYVLEGRGEHVLFAFADDGALRERRREQLRAGDLIFMPHGTIHTLGPAGGRLSTIFAYAPPIGGMGVYDPPAGRGCIVSDDCGAWWPTLPEQIVREFHFTPRDHPAGTLPS
jgi:cysteine dioxygenase